MTRTPPPYRSLRRDTKLTARMLHQTVGRATGWFLVRVVRLDAMLGA